VSTAIQKAVIARFDGAQGAGTVYLAVGGRLWYDEAPEKETTPYVVFRIVDDTFPMTFADTLIKTRVQFDIWDEDPEPDTVNDVAKKLKARFHRQVLTYADADYTHVGCVAESRLGPLREGEYWRVTTDFRIDAQET